VSINGIPGSPAGYVGYGPLGSRVGGVPAERTNGGQSRIGTPPSPPAAGTASDADRVLSAEAPAGIDPALWSVLSAEERQFFGRIQSMGPLTYGPRSANVPPGMLRGGRIDRTV
jgi:hypothetical protein